MVTELRVPTAGGDAAPSPQWLASRAQARQLRWQRWQQGLLHRARHPLPAQPVGSLQRATGLVLQAVGLRTALGALCEVQRPGQAPVPAEVVGFDGERVFLMPTGEMQGLASGAAVRPRPPDAAPLLLGHDSPLWRRGEDQGQHLPMGDALLGRVLDAHGQPLDGDGPLAAAPKAPLARRHLNALQRARVEQPLDVGVRAINALLTVGRGQRVGLLAGTGVGKSTLLGMLARHTPCDVIVVGLIGERTREVHEFVHTTLGAAGRRRAVVVAAPADAPPLVRVQGAHYAAALAEHHRHQGRHVLLLMDSLTRYAMALREIGLALGEPPATRGYPPSVFAKLPQLVERGGNGVVGVAGSGAGGSITAFYTVLTEGDDLQDPVADAARGLLDGQIVLSRALAEAGHHPAIDIERSVSRVMDAVTPPEQQAAARRTRQLLARWQQARDLIALGAYQPGADASLDEAVRLSASITHFLQQGAHERVDLAASLAGLQQALGT